MAKTDRTVVRNQPYKRGGVGIRERHNERKNEHYSNPDIVQERIPLNIQFRQCDTSYEQALDGMLERGEVSARGLKPDAKMFAEMVFDVNTGYFERHGGYDYARQFFGEVYRFAEKEVGADYILSAVMHADERNRGLSDQLGRDVYHYHLHVIYIPVVKKEIKWSKRCKDKALVGTTKEIIHQISHSKKWAFPTMTDEHGERKRVTSYSLLQTRFFAHMRDAGYSDLERGVEGSTTEHLSQTEYKVQREQERLREAQGYTMEAEEWLGEMTDRIREVKPVSDQLVDVDTIGRRKRLSSKVEMTETEYQKLTRLAKAGIAGQKTIDKLNERLRGLSERYDTLLGRFDQLAEETRHFFQAMKEAPERVRTFLTEVIQKAQEAREQRRQERLHPQPRLPKPRTRGYDRDSR